MSNVTNFRFTASKLLPKVRDTAKSSSNIVFIPPLVMRSMAGAIVSRQVLECLRSGRIVGKPSQDLHGAWQFDMEREFVNLTLQIKVIAESKGAAITRLIVLWENE
jgi:hypothetical protein